MQCAPLSIQRRSGRIDLDISVRNHICNITATSTHNIETFLNLLTHKRWWGWKKLESTTVADGRSGTWQRRGKPNNTSAVTMYHVASCLLPSSTVFRFSSVCILLQHNFEDYPKAFTAVEMESLCETLISNAFANIGSNILTELPRSASYPCQAALSHVRGSEVHYKGTLLDVAPSTPYLSRSLPSWHPFAPYVPSVFTNLKFTRAMHCRTGRD